MKFAIEYYRHVWQFINSYMSVCLSPSLLDSLLDKLRYKELFFRQKLAQ